MLTDGRLVQGVAVALQHPVQAVEQPLAVGEVLNIVQGLDVGHHPLVGEGFLPVLLGDLDLALALHEVFDVDGGDLEALDGVGGGHGICGEEPAQFGGPLCRAARKLMT